MPNKSYIYAASAYLPNTVVKSVDLMDELKLESKYDISRKIIDEKMGIKERRFVDSHDNSHSLLATKAAEKMFEGSSITPADIDCVIYCGIDRDTVEPSAAHSIQHQLGANGFVFDVSNACHGVCDGMFIADSFIKRGYDNVLLVTAEIASEVTKAAIESIHKDRNNLNKMFGALTVGDAGGAMLISSQPGLHKMELVDFSMASRSKTHDLCYYKREGGEITGQMVMDKICAAMLHEHQRLLPQTLGRVGWSQPDFVIPHQVGQVPHERFSKMTNLSEKRLSKTFPFLGNIASATMPVNIARTLQEFNGKFKKIMLMGAGSGLSVSQIAIQT